MNNSSKIKWATDIFKPQSGKYAGKTIVKDGSGFNIDGIQQRKL